MKIGVAIPCYKGHISRLFDLLDSIESQTILPNNVVVSCSSSEEFEMIKEYSFPLKIITTIENKNASQNRNIAASNLLDMDYITFFDADDIMHPQRIESLLYVINNYNSDIILHNYSLTEFSESDILQELEGIKVRVNTLQQSVSGCITHVNVYEDRIYKIHHGHVTIKKYIFEEKVRFPEEPEFHKREDCVFCYRIFSLPNINNAYIENNLTYYKPSCTGGFS